MQIKTKLRKTKLLLVYRKLLQFLYSKKFNIDKDNIIQLANTTSYDRHPDLFTFCQNNFKQDQILNILSFGCSTGEECFTIRKYFPNSTVIGCDINKNSLLKAKENNNDQRIKFFASDQKTLAENGPYDIIFALSVLCKEPEGKILNDISKIFSFNHFNSILNTFYNNLKINGLLVLRNSNYMVEDTDIYPQLTTLKYLSSKFPLFSRNGLKLNPIPEHGEIFLKIK